MTSFTILVIHYDPRSQEKHRQVLEENGFKVLLAKDGATGMATFLEHEPDLILLEAMLPKVHGFEVCADLKKTTLGRKTPVVVMSSIYKGRRYRHEAMHTHGADDFLEMPMDTVKLVATLNKLLDRSGRLASDVETGS
ncbi:MAG: response regulator [Acidobacteria bacterium]|nr:MAG: response regulator [Acidobacteriota bacterium]